MVLIFETHSTSADNEAGVASGWYDVELSAAGREQAEELGRRYAGHVPVVVYCSDLLRARRTAEIAFRTTAVPIVADRRLRECDYGEMTRAPAVEIERLRLAAVTSPFPGGESYEDVAKRVSRWLEDVRGSLANGVALAIGHRATLYALEHLLNGIPLRDAVAAPWRWQAGWRYRV